ncbi:MAG: hypothetical protein GKC03_01215 [Methanomassiliicoccales archaeon]|nr:hypothetical protein [Methanomassiliicoccales archaeon]
MRRDLESIDIITEKRDTTRALLGLARGASEKHLDRKGICCSPQGLMV